MQMTGVEQCKRVFRCSAIPRRPWGEMVAVRSAPVADGCRHLNGLRKQAGATSGRLVTHLFSVRTPDYPDIY